MHTQCSKNKPMKVKFYCIYIISNVVCTCVPSLGLLAPAFQEKQAKTHKKAKMGNLIWSTIAVQSLSQKSFEHTSNCLTDLGSKSRPCFDINIPWMLNRKP